MKFPRINQIHTYIFSYQNIKRNSIPEHNLQRFFFLASTTSYNIMIIRNITIVSIFETFPDDRSHDGLGRVLNICSCFCAHSKNHKSALKKSKANFCNVTFSSSPSPVANVTRILVTVSQSGADSKLAMSVV